MSGGARSIAMVEIAGRGGICHYTACLLEQLRQFVDIKLYTGEPFELAGRTSITDVSPVFRSYRTSPFRLFGMFARIGRDRPQAVHIQLSQAPAFVWLLTLIFKLMRLPVVITAHNVLPHEDSKLAGWALRGIYRRADAIIVHSEHCRGLLKSQFGAAAHRKAHVLDHGDYMMLSGPAAPSESDPAVFTILFFGFIRPYKGLDILIRAAGRLKAQGAPFKLLIVGRPVEPFDEYRALLRELDLESCTECVLEYVSLEDVSGYFHRSSCVVLPYLDASQSGVLQLAYAHAKPVIATRIGGLPEAVEEGRSGLLVAPGDAVELADRLRQLLEDPSLRRSLSEGALRLTRSRFSWVEIARKTALVYAECA